MNLKFLSGAILLGLCAGGCTTTGGIDSIPANDNMDSVTWLQTSTEYAGVTRSIYASAAAALRQIAAIEGDGTRNLSIVMDIDETVLDNSRYQGQLILDDKNYGSESWDRWVALRAADAVPGVVEFIQVSQSLGFKVDFITNRTCRVRDNVADRCPQKNDTLVNLKTIGVNTDATTLALRGDVPSERCRSLLTPAEQSEGIWSSDKTSRRSCVSLDRKIIMLFGDQVGDFTEAHEDAPHNAGRDIASKHNKRWGKSWFMLPNPTYGGWKPRTVDEKQSLLQGI